MLPRLLTPVLLACFMPSVPADEPADTEAVGTNTETDPMSTDALFDMSLDQLMDIEVEIVTKAPQRVSAVPAAVTVITGEDIRRSGATSIPEALRLAPGVEAARVNGNSWAVTVRGFNGYLANKLLVLMDGRSVYTPLFAGTYWDTQDTLLDDIDRIEIIRGPGATVWGANAVNGVINIITKSAKDTQGILVKGGGGTEQHGLFGVRYGSKLSDELFFRIYGKYQKTDDLIRPSGVGANDGFDMMRGGFRLDWEPQRTVAVTFQGDLYSGHENNTYMVIPTGGTFPAALEDYGRLRGGNLLARLTKELAGDTKLTLQTYYDRTVRKTVMTDENRDTGDIELRLNGAAGDRHDWSLGAGYRVSGDRITAENASVAFIPAERTTHLFSAFVQDQITLRPERLTLTLGSKFEHNDYTGFEFQPGVRLQYLPGPRHSLWLAVTRAVRTPARSLDDMRITPSPGVSINGSRAVDSEDLLAYEAGYKVRFSSRANLSAAVFYNVYDNLVTTEPTIVSFAPPVIRSVFANNMEGEAYGVELAQQYQATDWWRLSASYSHLRMDLRTKPGSGDTTSVWDERRSPRHTVSLRSRMDLPKNVQVDVFGRFVDNVSIRSAQGTTGIPAYWTVDARVGWKPRPDLEVAVIGKNLLDPSHPEFVDTVILQRAVEAQRAVLATLTWTF